MYAAEGEASKWATGTARPSATPPEQPSKQGNASAPPRPTPPPARERPDGANSNR